jgi:hypothetical protein
MEALKGAGASAPGAPAITEDGTKYNIALLSFRSPNLITQTVDTPSWTITNIAQPGHAFLGQVTTTVEPLMGNWSVMHVVGTGVAGEAWWRGVLNDVAGYLLFGSRNYALKPVAMRRMVLLPLLVVELKLKLLTLFGWMQRCQEQLFSPRFWFCSPRVPPKASIPCGPDMSCQ